MLKRKKYSDGKSIYINKESIYSIFSENDLLDTKTSFKEEYIFDYRKITIKNFKKNREYQIFNCLQNDITKKYIIGFYKYNSLFKRKELIIIERSFFNFMQKQYENKIKNLSSMNIISLNNQNVFSDFVKHLNCMQYSHYEFKYYSLNDYNEWVDSLNAIDSCYFKKI